MARTGENVYNLKDWANFRQSKKWSVYCGVVEQYSAKYRKVYRESEGKNTKNNSEVPPLSSPTKRKNK